MRRTYSASYGAARVIQRRVGGQEQGGIAGRCDSGTRCSSSVITVEDSAGGDDGGIHGCHSNEADPDL